MERCKFKCRGCSISKERNYEGQNKTGNNIYLDENGDKWSGLHCYSCTLTKCRNAARIKSGAGKLLITFCIQCNIKFQQSSSIQFTCSKICYRKWLWKKEIAKKPKRKCVYCSKELDIYTKKYCSSECSYRFNYVPKGRSIKALLDLVCQQCKSSFRFKYKKRYCSKVCASSAPKAEKKNYIRKLITKEQVCVCGKLFINKTKNQKSCSLVCNRKQDRKKNRKKLKVYDKTRELKKIQRVPKWVDMKEINRIYKECPPGHHVDHIIPLNGKNVCGFHVEYNLQYLSAEDNALKSNKCDGTYENNSWKLKHQIQ